MTSDPATLWIGLTILTLCALINLKTHHHPRARFTQADGSRGHIRVAGAANVRAPSSQMHVGGGGEQSNHGEGI